MFRIFVTPRRVGKRFPYGNRLQRYECNIKNNIAIVGGGPGGLTLARLLQVNGVNVKVYERDSNPQVRVQGATLDLHHDSGLAALRAAGLMNEFKEKYRPGADKLVVVDKYAQIAHEDDFEIDDDHELSRPEIDRGPLRDILLNSLKPGTVVWDSQFTGLTQQNDCIKLDFTNGQSAYAHLVIGADGANSKIRPYITKIKPFYSGVTVIEGAVYDSEVSSPRIHKIMNGGKIFALSDGRCLIVSSKGDGSLVFYFSFNCHEDWAKTSGINFSNKQQVFNWFKTEYAGWADIWHELFDNAEPVFFPRPQYCIPFNQTWHALPNLTMLGDAAHLMPPFAGEGVNMAMLDALELSQCLLSESYQTTTDAIAAYETKMLARTAEVARETMQQTASFHSPDGLVNLITMFSEFRGETVS